MSVELAALIFAVLGPIASGYAIYLARRSNSHFTRRLNNDMPHLIARLNEIEARVARLENWMMGERRP